MRQFRFVLIVALALIATGVFAQNVTYDLDRSADFSRFRTYAWVKGHELTDGFNHQRVVAAVNRQLGLKGMVEVPVTARPDLFIAYHASFERDLRITGFSSGWGGYRWGAMRSGSARADEILVGTLAVDVINAQTSLIVWRAVAVKDIDPTARPDERDRSINKAAEKLFKQYPSTAVIR
jgi:hypothetical protein